MRLDRGTAGSQPVVLGLAVWNPNDYDVSTARLELQLQLDNVTVGHFKRDSVIPVPQTGLADLTLPLTVPSGAMRERIKTMAKGTHRFAVEGRATFSTPFGRRNVRFAHAGDVAFGNEVEGSGITAASVRVRRGLRQLGPPSVRPYPDEVSGDTRPIGGGGREQR